MLRDEKGVVVSSSTFPRLPADWGISTRPGLLSMTIMRRHVFMK
jgi:hypothetical protein